MNVRLNVCVCVLAHAHTHVCVLIVVYVRICVGLSVYECKLRVKTHILVSQFVLKHT